MGVGELKNLRDGLMHHFADEVRLHAFEATMLVFNSVFWSILAVVVFRDPRHGLIWLLGPLLCTVGALSERTRVERARAIAVNLLQFGFFQFLYSALEPYWLAVALVTPFAVWIASKRRRGNNAGAVMVASIMNFEKGSFLIGLDTFCMLVALITVIVPTYLLLDRMLFGSREWPGSPSTPRMPGDAVIRRICAFMFALFLFDMLDWKFGYWIPLTVGLCYSGGGSGKTVRHVAMLRLIWAPLGFTLAVAWLGTVGYIDYQFNYLAVIWAFVAFYYCFRADDYIGFYLLFMVMISGANNLSMGEFADYGNGWNMIVQSTFAVAIGAGLVELAEFRLDPSCCVEDFEDEKKTA